MRPRGFTFIEISIVMAIMVVLLLPFLTVGVSTYRQLEAATRQADLKSEADRAAWRIFGLAANRGAYHIDADNHGSRFGGGQHARWEGDRLLLDGEQILAQRVVEFKVVRDGRVLTLNLALAAPGHAGGRDVVSRHTYDYPRVGVLP